MGIAFILDTHPRPKVTFGQAPELGDGTDIGERPGLVIDLDSEGTEPGA